MAKTFLEDTKEQQGFLPALTGALCRVASIDRTKTGENAKVPGCRMYVVQLQVKKPEGYAGRSLSDFIVIGTEKDPRAKQAETWNRQEGGPGRLKRLLVKSGTPITEEDDEWMEAAVDREVVTPVSARPDENGFVRNRPGLYYNPTDEDCPEIGEAAEAVSKGGASRGAGKAKGAAAASKRARGRTKAVEADEDEDETPPAKTTAATHADDDEDEEDEKPKKPAKPADDEDDDDDD